VPVQAFSRANIKAFNIKGFLWYPQSVPCIFIVEQFWEEPQRQTPAAAQSSSTLPPWRSAAAPSHDVWQDPAWAETPAPPARGETLNKWQLAEAVRKVWNEGNFCSVYWPFPKNKKPLNANKREVMAHYYRDDPPMFNLSLTNRKAYAQCEGLLNRPRSWERLGPLVDVARPLAWLSLRQVNLDMFESITKEPMMWGENREVHHPDYGETWRCVLKAPIPELGGTANSKRYNQDGTITVVEGGITYQANRCIHSSSFYSAAKILTHGLVPGECTKQGIHGVYCFDMGNKGGRKGAADVAAKSHSYAVSTCLFQDNVFWSIKYELAAFQWYSGHKKHPISAGGKQWAFPLDMGDGYGPWFHLVAIWLHGATWDQIKESEDDINVETKFYPPYELAA